MNTKVWLLFSAITVSAAVLAVACGDDDTGGGGITPTPDSGTSGNTSGGIDSGGTDGGGTDGGCTFAGFVTDLIKTKTNATATPSTDLGEACTPSTSQADFDPVFKP